MPKFTKFSFFLHCRSQSFETGLQEQAGELNQTAASQQERQQDPGLTVQTIWDNDNNNVDKQVEA